MRLQPFHRGFKFVQGVCADGDVTYQKAKFPLIVQIHFVYRDFARERGAVVTFAPRFHQRVFVAFQILVEGLDQLRRGTGNKRDYVTPGQGADFGAEKRTGAFVAVQNSPL